MQCPASDLVLGPIVNSPKLLSMSSDQRSTHLHVVGNTGSGKSKFLEHLIRQDILANRRNGSGLLLIDPHGSLYDNIIQWMAMIGLQVPVIPIDLRRDDWIVSYNLLRKREHADPSVIVDSIVDAIAHVWGALNTKETPRFAKWIANSLRVLYEKDRTLIDIVHLLANDRELRRAMTEGVGDDMTRRDWQMVENFKPREFEDEVSSTINRLKPFVTNERLRSMFGQPTASLDLGTALEEGSIILVSLARKGAKVSKENADLFATLLLNDLWTAAQERDKNDRPKPFSVYIDEFQRFLSPTIAENLDEARGFGLRLILSHQFPNQLRNSGDIGKRVYDSVMENARSKVVFSLSMPENLEPMAEWLFMATMNPNEIKHSLYSTRVVGYQEEYRRAYSHGVTRSEGGTSHSSSSSGEGSGGSSPLNTDPDSSGSMESWNSYFASAQGNTDSWSESGTESTTEVPTLIPILEKELASVQFRSLEEQLFRAMAALFDQKQRQCVVRLQGMKAPVSIFTPFIAPTYIRKERVEEYMRGIYQRLPFALPGNEARSLIEAHNNAFAENIINEARQIGESDEPVTAKRRLR